MATPNSDNRPKEPSTSDSASEGPQTGSPATSSTASESGPDEAPALPPLTPEEFRVYNRVAEQMDYFHNHFRSMWNTLYNACRSGRRPANMTLKQFLDEGLQLTKYLEMHHTIEEAHLYPVLGRRMPQFASSGHPPIEGLKAKNGKKGERKEGCELLRQHQEIHKGMDELEEYIQQCKSGEKALELPVLKEKLDTWGEVLMKHLDQEVVELGAEVMRKYWTLAEMRAFPI